VEASSAFNIPLRRAIRPRRAADVQMTQQIAVVPLGIALHPVTHERARVDPLRSHFNSVTPASASTPNLRLIAENHVQKELWISMPPL